MLAAALDGAPAGEVVGPGAGLEASSATAGGTVTVHAIQEPAVPRACRCGRVRAPRSIPLRPRVLAGVLVALAALLLGACGTGAPTDSGTATAGPAQVPSVKPDFEIPSGQDPPGELVVEQLRAGDGAEAGPGDTLRVHYVGRAWSTGREFDASWDRGQPLTFELGAGQVIPGWEQGLEGMRVGARRKLIIPARLAYGDRGAGQAIGPGETLVFVIDLLGVS